MNTILEQLSDMTYREKAAELVDEYVEEHGVLITRSQIHGLRQIAIQQPGAIKSFADHQRERIEKKMETAGGNSRQKLESQAAFWKLVADLCEPNKLPWSPASEADAQMPSHLRESNIPAKADCKTNEERGQRKKLKAEQKQWLDAWNAEHVPTFFQRFCTHYLYHLGKQEATRRD
ncbi:MAG: hypothetical protein KatS3mg105_5129 [Gemmatales bacterium]|nr:MAG: hypothetical protein KatS3mg105_5129 [Gemmatales bacterium]GIW97859.1 MAG: hypothetical protein KatS3mg111_1192 [Pirellulaceae bacterium]